MSTLTKKNSPWPELNVSSGDGRHQRSGRSRRKIIEALFELMREGEMSPLAVDVASRAGVGLRTVFRHFEDMESIFEEMTAELKAIVMPKVTAPFESENWQDKLTEFVDRNATIYESIFPMLVALTIRRFQSDILMKQYNRDVVMLRNILTSILPKEIRSNKNLFSALEVNLSFATWRSLREDQNLTIKNSKEALKLALRKLTDDHHSKK